jgi:2-phospho-L-lactate guanylyltransferase
MQGTIATFDPDSRSGTLILDDGTELHFGSAAFDGSALRRLRIGQRVDIVSESSGEVRTVRIPGIA